MPLGSPGSPRPVSRPGRESPSCRWATADAVAVVDLLNRRVLQRIQLAEGSGATGAIMVNDSIAYVANPGLNTISRVNVFTRETAEVPVGVTPQGFAVARGRVFVLNGNLDQTGEPAGPSWITVINPATNEPATGIDSIPLTGPGNAAFATVAGDGLLYVVNRGRTTPAEGRLSVVDPLERREVASFAGLGLLPGPVATDGQSRVFVSLRDARGCWSSTPTATPSCEGKARGFRSRGTPAWPWTATAPDLRHRGGRVRAGATRRRPRARRALQEIGRIPLGAVLRGRDGGPHRAGGRRLP